MPTKHRREAEKMKMAGYTYFPFDVVDWLTSTDVQRMTPAQEGLYIRMLACQWRDGTLPSDRHLCAKVLLRDRRLLDRWMTSFGHLFPVLQTNPQQMANEKLYKIAVSVGKLIVPEGAEEKRREERILDLEERETGSSSPREEKIKTSGASGRSSEEQVKGNPKKDCGCADGLCDWTEPVTGCTRPGSIGDAIYFQRHIKRNEYFIPKLSTGYVREQWKRLLNDTPEDWSYDPDPMIREKRINLEGESILQKHIMRRPKNAKERAVLLKNPEQNRKWLFDPACPNHCREGLLDVPTYPDADPSQMLGRITHGEYCECIVKEKDSAMEAGA